MAGNHRVVALNIGTSNIVAVQGLVDDAEQGKRTAVIEKITSIPTPRGAVRSNGIHMPDALAETLKELWRRDGLQTKNVIMGVDSRRLQSGQKWVAYISPKQLAETCTPYWVNSMEILPRKADVNNSIISHFVLRERTITDPNSQGGPIHQILLMVIDTPKAEVQALANVAEDAGLELVGMDLVAFGVLRAARIPVREDRRVVDMFVDVGETHTTMLMHNNGNIRAVETVSGSAGESVTRSIAESLKVFGKDVAGRGKDAETIKTTLAQMVRNDPEDPITKAAVASVGRQARSLVRDFDSFLRSYVTSVNEAGVSTEEGAPVALHPEERGLSSITLTGGGSALHGLAEALVNPDLDGLNLPINQASISRLFVNADGSPVPPFVNGISVVSTVGLLTADRKAV